MSREKPPWGTFVQNLQGEEGLFSIYRDNRQTDPTQRVRVYMVADDGTEKLMEWKDMIPSMKLAVMLLAGPTLQ